MYYIIGAITLQCFHIVMHCCAGSFSIKVHIKLTIFFISKTKQICAETLTVSESTFKLKAMSRWTLFEILLTSAVTCKQRFLHVNKILQILQNY